jgi:hypothetical protein
MGKVIGFSNFLDTVVSYFKNEATAQRTYTFPNRSGTIALDVMETVLVTGATVLDSTAFGKLHDCSGTSADYTITLPSAVGNEGKSICIKGNPLLASFDKVVTIDGDGTEKLDDISSIAISTGGYIILVAREIAGVGHWDIVAFDQGAYITWAPTFTGYSVNPTYDVCKYKRDVKTMHFSMRASAHGTSNATTLTFTLPPGIVPAFVQRLYVPIILNNGVQTSTGGGITLIADDNVAQVFLTVTGTGWTASNGKSFSGNFTIAIK